MIKTANGWLYSPQPPEMYACGGYGHGVWFCDNTCVWNILWLSFPNVDSWLSFDDEDGEDDDNVLDMLYSITKEDLSRCSSVAAIVQDFSPTSFLLRYKGACRAVGWDKAYHRDGRTIYETGVDRFNQINVQKGNVVHVDFKRAS